MVFFFFFFSPDSSAALKPKRDAYERYLWRSQPTGHRDLPNAGLIDFAQGIQAKHIAVLSFSSCLRS